MIRYKITFHIKTSPTGKILLFFPMFECISSNFKRKIYSLITKQSAIKQVLSEKAIKLIKVPVLINKVQYQLPFVTENFESAKEEEEEPCKT